MVTIHSVETRGGLNIQRTVKFRLLSAVIKVISALPFCLKYLHPVLMSRKKIFTPLGIN